MSVYSFRESLEKNDPQITAKPLAPNIKINPNKSMVMFNLGGTLTRNGVLLSKTLKYATGKSLDKVFGDHQENIRIPLLHTISNNIELLFQKNKHNYALSENIFNYSALYNIVKNALYSQNENINLNDAQLKKSTTDICDYLHHMLINTPETKAVLDKSLEIYEQQIAKKNKSFIAPEVTQIIHNLANLGVPVAIVSNMTQEIVNDAFAAIMETLPEVTRKKCKSHKWHFTKIGVQRDIDGDVIQSIKPAADLLAVSYRKANKFNMKNNKEPIKNIVFVGSSEAFDMRAADNLQRSNYGQDNHLNVYKLFCSADNPAKTVQDQEMIKNKSALKNMSAVNDRLISAFQNKNTLEKT